MKTGSMPTEESLAFECGVSRRTLSTYRARGCRAATADGVKDWRERNVLPRQGGPPALQPAQPRNDRPILPTVDDFLEVSKYALNVLDLWEVACDHPELLGDVAADRVRALRAACLAALIEALRRRRQEAIADA
jgi:hypothetical protein